MIFQEYQQFDKPYIVHRTTGTGAQGDTPLEIREPLGAFDTPEEANEFGKKLYPNVTGWDYENYTINVNTNTVVGKDLYEGFLKEWDNRLKDIEENSNEYNTITLIDGTTIHMRKDNQLDNPNYFQMAHDQNKKQMTKYIGTKEIEARPMLLGEYNEYRGWQIPANEDPFKAGYLVRYEDGYESWSPVNVFESAYRKSGEMDFGHALVALKQGKMVQRAGWNGKGMFIFIRPADQISYPVVINNVKSLPKSVKDYFYFNAVDKEQNPVQLQEMPDIKFTAYLCMKAADGSIVNGWLASQTDMLAEDWSIL